MDARLQSAAKPSRGRIARSALAAVLIAALTGFVTLLVAILSLLAATAAGARPDMSFAYRGVAMPVAIAMVPVAFFAYLLWERRTSSRH